MANDRYPTARSERLLVEAFEQELLLYDLDTDRAHALDERAAAIWRACDGNSSVSEIASRTANDDAAVESTLERLAELGLLTEATSVPAVHTRRSVLRRGAIAGAVGVAAAPIIQTIVTPTAAQAGGTCIPSGQACDVNSPVACCSQCCQSTFGGTPPFVCC